jgi:hypothetical protein
MLAASRHSAGAGRLTAEADLKGRLPPTLAAPQFRHKYQKMTWETDQDF